MILKERKVKLNFCFVMFQAKAAQRTGLFIIEWIPNVLPKSNYGEMRIKFQFGHMTNNRVVKL